MDPKHDDLLKPTLRPGIDVARFDRPWNPSSLMYVAFFGGIAGGGALFAINAKRLGMPEEVRRIVIGTVVLTLVSTVAVAWFVVQAGDDREAMRANRGMVRFAVVAVGLVLANWMAKRQRPSYEAYDYSDREKGTLWPYAVGALLFGAVVHGVLYLVAMLAFRAAQGNA